MSRVVHFEIHASRPELVIEFYRSLLGWKVERWGESPYWLVETGPKEAPGINGGLVERHGEPPVEGQAVNAFVCTVSIDALDATVERAIALGGSLALPRMPIAGIGWLAYVKDPDGNLLGLLESDPEAA